MTFPLPDVNTADSADATRDERKREASPPSSFYAQSQAVLTAVSYFEPLNSGYEATAKKHRNRIRSALFAQLMATFEFTIKDFVAQILDETHIYDDEVGSWDWIKVDLRTVLATRQGTGRIGSVLIHPLLGWQNPADINKRYRDVFRKPIVWDKEEQILRDLWIVRHSVAHNGGFVTEPDARRLRSAPLTNKPILIDSEYLEATTGFLRGIVGRLNTIIGPVVMKHYFERAATRDWTQDQTSYTRLKLITTYVESRPQPLPQIAQSMYTADEAANPPPPQQTALKLAQPTAPSSTI